MHTPSNRIKPCGELMPPGLFGSTTIDCSACTEKANTRGTTGATGVVVALESVSENGCQYHCWGSCVAACHKAAQSLPSPANDVGFNLGAGPGGRDLPPARWPTTKSPDSQPIATEIASASAASGLAARHSSISSRSIVVIAASFHSTSCRRTRNRRSRRRPATVRPHTPRAGSAASSRRPA
jgi:hypothetical protein